MEGIELLPQVLREQSLSQREIVLPYQEALTALELLISARWALLGWEGWVTYSDGSHAHAPGGTTGTTSIEREASEAWEDYVQRSAQFCAETMRAEQQRWDADPTCRHLTLHFCLTATPPEIERR